MPSGKFIIMYITYGKVFGGTPFNNVNVLVISFENGSISERTVNRVLIVHTTLIKFCINKKNILIFILRHVPTLSIGFKYMYYEMQ